MIDEELAAAAAHLARAAAGFAPSGNAPEPVSGRTAAEILHVLRANKVSLLDLAADGDSRASAEWRSFSANEAVAAALSEERRMKEALFEAYRPVAGALAEAGIAHLLFKSLGGFPYLSSNLDLLVAPESFRRAASILEDLGHVRIPHYREDHKLLFRTFDGPSLSVHLHEAVSWGKVMVLHGKDVVSRRVPGEDPATFASSPQDCLTATLLHSVLETDQVRLSDLLTARRCLERGASLPGLLEAAVAGGFLAAAASALIVYDTAGRRTGFGPLLSREDQGVAGRALLSRSWAYAATGRALRRARTTLPFALPRRFAKILLLGLILGDGRKEAGRQVGDLAWSGWNLVTNRLGLRCRPPSLITVSGPDGSGKSEVVRAVAGALRVCEVPVSTVWNRGGFSQLALAGKALARRTAPRRVPSVSDEAAKRVFLGSRRRRWLWAWWIAIEQAVSVQRIRLLLLSGRTVVCDRYIYDSLADFISRVPRSVWSSIPRRAASLLLGAARTPDLAIFIDVSPEASYSRKPDAATLDSRRSLVAAYGQVEGLARFHHVDGGLSLAGLVQAGVEAAVKRCLGRFAGDPS